MPNIEVLDQQTIDKIAAGEVIERPASVVKELVENAIDARATAITVEIKEGGISFIRITDNGWGIEKEQVPLAFLRHSTSKIRSVEDLLTVSSLGFRGEALSSIAAVSQVELITKTAQGISGVRYVIEGSKEKTLEEIGAPDGTTFLVRNLFYNTPARRKFLKTPQTEAGYIGDLMERLAMSHPEISFKFINNNQVKLHTSGNSNLKEIIYHIYGRDIASNLLEIQGENEMFSVKGFIGKPLISRGNRNFENYFINGRYVKSSLIAKSIEEGYKSFVMQHKYPFTVLHLSINGQLLDVNVHPTKMELRFSNGEVVYHFLEKLIRDTINQGELVYQVSLEKEREAKAREEQARKERLKSEQHVPEPFEAKRLEAIRASIRKDTPYERKYPEQPVISKKSDMVAEQSSYTINQKTTIKQEPHIEHKLPEQAEPEFQQEIIQNPVQEDMRKLLDVESKKDHRIIGQIFETYWLIEFDDHLYIIDQHAAHEKVLYERTMKSLENKEFTSQTIYPPVLLTLNMQEEELLKKYMDYFKKLGFEIEPFGGKEYSVTAVPGNLFGLDGKQLMVEILDSLASFHGNEKPDMITEKIASMSCKAAVKGNQKLSMAEIEKLIDELLTLENPYHCPHGRPTIISMSKYELEKKFKRVL
ncbi:DNA mismatch repair endonuclease MutL [Roseburia sp. 499]|uniref:DNA mismatch repair endonuclease MutL n=1 Tax=Roseburia sp. 499 TaxID=1261634 RepID=UPI0009522EF0|nr:DNA mismatch repair endonuclease MutL [Roseburia sp. 499]WVK71424.1 DNA mismatch repair endonuclease MutL [Roseburia sp. 499]